MSTWTGQMGFPVISVQSRQEGADRVLTLSQSKFVKGAAGGDVARYMWQIPISIIRQGSIYYQEEEKEKEKEKGESNQGSRFVHLRSTNLY